MPAMPVGRVLLLAPPTGRVPMPAAGWRAV